MQDNFNKITSLIKNNKFIEAINLLKTLTEDEKKNPNYFFLKGIVHVYLSEFNNAIDDLTSAININSKNSKLYFYRGYSY